MAQRLSSGAAYPLLPHSRQFRGTGRRAVTGAPEQVERSGPRQAEPGGYERVGPQMEQPFPLHGVMPYGMPRGVGADTRAFLPERPQQPGDRVLHLSAPRADCASVCPHTRAGMRAGRDRTSMSQHASGGMTGCMAAPQTPAPGVVTAALSPPSLPEWFHRAEPGITRHAVIRPTPEIPGDSRVMRAARVRITEPGASASRRSTPPRPQCRSRRGPSRTSRPGPSPPWIHPIPPRVSPPLGDNVPRSVGTYVRDAGAAFPAVTRPFGLRVEEPASARPARGGDPGPKQPCTARSGLSRVSVAELRRCRHPWRSVTETRDSREARMVRVMTQGANTRGHRDT